MRVFVLLSVFLLISLAICANVQQATNTINAKAGGPDGVIFYANLGELDGSIQGPISVDIVMEDGVAFPQNGVNFCFNPDQTFPVSGLDVANSCPTGGYAVFMNTTTGATAEPMKFRISARNSAFKNQFFSKMIQIVENGVSQTVNGYQSSSGPQFVASINGGDDVYNFTIAYTYDYCAAADEVAVDGNCEKVEEITIGAAATIVTVPAATIQYYQFSVDSYENTVNNQVSITFNGSSSMVYVQRNAIPTSTYNLFPTSGNASPYVIVTPSRFENGQETYFVALNNSGTDAVTFSVQVNNSACTSNTTFGTGCTYSTATTNSTDVSSSIILLSATYTSDSTPIELDASDSTSGYQYFLVDQLPFNDTALPYYVRVTVGNDVIDGDDDDPESPAPQILAKLNGYPSDTSYDYNVANGFTNQLVLPVTSLDDQWYVAVALSTGPKFSIWVGSNCAGNCDDNAHGNCMCYNTTSATAVNCNSFGDNYYDAFYSSLPQSTLESNGECECNDEDYVYSYDCSEKPPSTILFVTLIVIGGLIILFVAIGVPLYCYISNKRKERYERI